MFKDLSNGVVSDRTFENVQVHFIYYTWIQIYKIKQWVVCIREWSLTAGGTTVKKRHIVETSISCGNFYTFSYKTSQLQ